MNRLRPLHQIKKTSMNSKGMTTLYFFDIWEWRVSSEIFDKCLNSKQIFITDSFPFQQNEYNVADHCSFLFKSSSPELNLPANGRIRISMAALVKIVYQDRIILLVEKKTIKPFGGAYWFTRLPKISSLKLDNPATNDLRFTVDISDLDQIESWYSDARDREITPERELYEELCLENEILDKVDLELIIP